MRRASAIALAVLIGLSASVIASAWADEPAQKDLDSMLGTWSVESFVIDGAELPEEVLKTWTRIVEVGHVTWKQNGETFLELDIHIDPTPKPMRLDSTISTGDSKDQVLAGIYEFDGDLLKVCFSGPGQPRPTEFSCPEGSGLGLYTCKRIKR